LVIRRQHAEHSHEEKEQDETRDRRDEDAENDKDRDKGPSPCEVANDPKQPFQKNHRSLLAKATSNQGQFAPAYPVGWGIGTTTCH
jgi:hypothetical protein